MLGNGSQNMRPAITEALRLCRLHKATLVSVKLDRLARIVHSISSLMESGVDFVACDFPEANRLTVRAVCHSPVGINSVNSRLQLLKPNPPQLDPDPPYDALRWETQNTAYWKATQYDWGLLNGYWHANAGSRPR